MSKEKKTIAIYTGSFNPFHIGHLNILEKAEAIFGEENVIVVVGVNPEKLSKDTLSAIQRYDSREKTMLLNNIKNTAITRVKNQIPTKNVEGFIGFLTNYINSKEDEGYSVVVVRGLRSGYDLDSEYTQTRYMWDQKPNLKIVYIPCDPLYAHVSSSGYRALETIEPGSGKVYLANSEIRRVNL